MKANEVLGLLRVTRPTLTRYVRDGIIKVEVMPNGRYDYDTESVYSFLNKNVNRKTCIYARVSTPEQKTDLNDQIESLKQFCFTNGYVISNIYADISNGIDFEKHTNFFKMLDDIIDNKVERVVIAYKDRLSRVGFALFQHLFKKHNCEIIVMSGNNSDKLDSKEISGEITSFLECYSPAFSNKRNVKKIKEILSSDN